MKYIKKIIKKILTGVPALLFFITANNCNARHIWMPIWDNMPKYNYFHNSLIESKNYNTSYLGGSGEIISATGIQKGVKIFNRSVIAIPSPRTITHDKEKKEEEKKEEEFLDINTLDIYGEIRTMDLEPVFLFSSGRPKPNDDDIYDFPCHTSCPLKIQGAVILDATRENIKVNIKSPVAIEPLQNSYSTPNLEENKTHSINFITGKNRKIVIDVQHELNFRSLSMREKRPGYFPEEPKLLNELMLNFAGEGQTVFLLSDKAEVVFFDGKQEMNSYVIGKDDLISTKIDGYFLSDRFKASSIRIKANSESVVFVK